MGNSGGRKGPMGPGLGWRGPRAGEGARPQLAHLPFRLSLPTPSCCLGVPWPSGNSMMAARDPSQAPATKWEETKTSLSLVIKSLN